MRAPVHWKALSNLFGGGGLEENQVGEVWWLMQDMILLDADKMVTLTPNLMALHIRLKILRLHREMPWSFKILGFT